jgi:CheY-like chemotaxis protein
MSERYCILCVDDNVRCLEARAALLEEEGYSVTTVSCPLKALDLLDAQMAQLKDEDAYAQSHSNSALSAVLLYKSLAGGWPQRPPQPPRGVKRLRH